MSEYRTSLKTTWVLAVIVVVLVVYDFSVRNVPGGTISEVILTIAKNSPVLPFLAGVLCGHLFWPQIEEVKTTQ